MANTTLMLTQGLAQDRNDVLEPHLSLLVPVLAAIIEAAEAAVAREATAAQAAVQTSKQRHLQQGATRQERARYAFD